MHIYQINLLHIPTPPPKCTAAPATTKSTTTGTTAFPCRSAASSPSSPSPLSADGQNQS